MCLRDRLLHPQIDEMVSQIKKIPGVRSVSLTTNAVLLAQHAKQDVYKRQMYIEAEEYNKNVQLKIGQRIQENRE